MGMDVTPSVSCGPCCSPVWWSSLSYFLGEDFEAFGVRFQGTSCAVGLRTLLGFALGAVGGSVSSWDL